MFIACKLVKEIKREIALMNGHVSACHRMCDVISRCRRIRRRGSPKANLCWVQFSLAERVKFLLYTQNFN